VIGSMRQWLAVAAGQCALPARLSSLPQSALRSRCAPGWEALRHCVPQPANNVMLLRAGIVAAGPLIAVLIVVGSRSWSRRPR